MSPANINHNNFWLSSQSRCCRHIVNFKRRCLWVSRVQSIECSKGPFITLWHYNHNYVVIVGPIKLLIKAYLTGKISWLYTLVKSRQIKKTNFGTRCLGLEYTCPFIYRELLLCWLTICFPPGNENMPLGLSGPEHRIL